MNDFAPPFLCVSTPQDHCFFEIPEQFRDLPEVMMHSMWRAGCVAFREAFEDVDLNIDRGEWDAPAEEKERIEDSFFVAARMLKILKSDLERWTGMTAGFHREQWPYIFYAARVCEMRAEAEAAGQTKQ